MPFFGKTTPPQSRLINGLGLCLLTILAVLAIGRTAEASIFLTVTDFFNRLSSSSTGEQPANSQKLAILEAATNSDPNPNKGAGDAVIVGDSAVMAEVGPMGTIADVEVPKNDQVSVYVVHAGDTIQSVAKMFDVSVNTIVWANDLKRGQKLKEGETLVILPVTGISYTVKKGDTLAKIAKRYKADVVEISKFNDLAGDKDLILGDQIIIPGGELVQQVTRQNYEPGGKWSGQDNSSFLIRPVRGCIKTQGIHPHNAVDIGCPVGTTMYAAAAGRVVVARQSGWNGGYGKYIVVQHSGGVQTLYGHLSRVNVGVGEKVSKGEVIGATGNTGNSTGPHLHFEVRGARNPF